MIANFAAAAALLIAFLIVEARSSHPMFDLRLFRLPTFVGGDIAAFGVSAGIFSILLYLVIYLQDVLGFSALQTGVRLLVLSGGILVASGISGRLSTKVPVRALIGPGLVLVGVGLLLMRGLTATSAWTHLIPGLILAGIGVGQVKPPLASTAIGVVEPRRAGMASGINSTFRQVGIATGIGLLGAVFSSRLNSAVSDEAAGTDLASQSSQISTALLNGGAARLIGSTPPPEQRLLVEVVRGAFTSALNDIMLIASIISIVAGVAAFALIRSKDFVPADRQ